MINLVSKTQVKEAQQSLIEFLRTFPSLPRSCRAFAHWALAVTLGLTCKALSGRASRKAQLDAYLMWHTLWHFLPVLSSLFLVAWAMDWEAEEATPLAQP